MPKMTPEQEAAYALDYAVSRSDLPPDVQLAYDRLAEQRALAASQAPSRPVLEDSRVLVLPRWAAALATAVFALIAQGAGVVLLPYALTRWAPGTPLWPASARLIGVALIAAGGTVVAWAFAQFATEGVGVPIPVEPNSQHLTVGGPYRYIRNPLYVASATAIAGQALLLSRAVLLIYAAAFLAATFFLAHAVEDPALARRYGQQFEDYRHEVPGWWPRLPRRTPSQPETTTRHSHHAEQNGQSC